jgi:cbb3-type cytochrome c oxidase subunit III
MGELGVRKLKVLLLVSSVVCLVFLLLAAFEENFTAEWYRYQHYYRDLLAEKASAAGKVAVDYPIEVRQVYLESLGRVDRCVTCHVAIDNPDFKDEPNPLKTHPGELLAHHPSDKFGCTICHQGQGQATLKDDAHGNVPHWPETLLSGQATYTSCGRCHYEHDLYGGQADLYGQVQPVARISQGELTTSLPGAANIAHGKQLVVENGCLGCHKYRGRGGNIGPELTHVGDKTVHDFDFRNVEGERTVENWMFTHFKSPSAVVPETMMPELGLTDDEAHDLTACMIGLKRKSAPAAYTPLPQPVDPTPVRGETLYKMYCSACHGADGQGAIVRDPEAARRIDYPRELITPSLHNMDTLAVVSDDYLRKIIAHGRAGTSMAAWTEGGGLSDDEIELLIGFIRTWEPREADRSFVSASRGNVRYGAALFRSNCAGCHGADGTGGDVGVSLRSSTFLSIASDEFLAGTILGGRPNTAMPSWKDFDNREVSDLLALLRSWQPMRSDREAVLNSPELRNTASIARAAETGRKLYRSRCAVCHGQDGEGNIGPSLNNQSVLTVVSNEFLHDTIVHGRPGTAMPAWRELSTDDTVDLIALLRSWQTEPSKNLPPVPVTGDPKYGELLYGGMCASCHGPNAEGAIGPQLANAAFLGTVSDAALIEWISRGRTGTPMRPCLRGRAGAGELSQSQIENIVVFLRSRRGEQIAYGQQIGLGFAPRGEALYRHMCAACHGGQGEGATGPGIRNPDFLAVASDGYLRATIVLGRSGTEMRPMAHGGSGIAELRADQINDLIAYLRSAEDRPSLVHRFVMGANPRRGAGLYANFCASCHGDDGRGGFAPELNNASFLRFATDGFLQATVIRGRRGTAMRPFGRGAPGLAELTQEQINDIVSHVRQWSPDTRPLKRTEPFEAIVTGGGGE